MKYFLSLLAIVALAGVGCTQNQATTERTSAIPAETNKNEQEASASPDEASPSIQITTDKGVITSQDGKTTVNEDNVPVTEILLGEPADVVVDMEATNFAFAPSTITAKAGDEIQIKFVKNEGFHTFAIDGIDTFAIVQGESIIFTAPAAGTYTFFCDIGSHRSMGMEGTLIVE